MNTLFPYALLERKKSMKVTLKYDQGKKKDEIVTLEVCEKDLEKMVELDYESRLAQANGDEIVMRTPTEMIEELNRQEYNAWRKHHRYLDKSLVYCNENAQMNVLDTIADDSQLKNDQRQDDYNEVCQKIRRILKPKQANMIIAICIDGMTVKEYAAEINDNPKRVSERFNYTKKVLKEALPKEIK